MGKTVFSGIQPSAMAPHLGNYLGALRQWVDLQKENHSYFSVVDLHAITVFQEKEALTEAIYTSYASLLAIGVDTKLSTLFVQSQVSAHSELSWILNCYTSVGQLSRMTQYKEKSIKQKLFVSAGLFDYPVLMAADILLYDTNLVPVGDDQIQHIELTRDIAIRFNNFYGKTFILPEPMIIKNTPRIRSLQEPTQKMSKSDANLAATIFITDSADIIVKKLKGAVTDSDNRIKFDKKRLGLYNLLSIYKALTEEDEQIIEKRYQGVGYGVFKKDLADIVVDKLAPIREKFNELILDKPELEKLMKENKEKACVQAAQKLREVKQKIGLVV